jgi:hypothetical protein
MGVTFIDSEEKLEELDKFEVLKENKDIEIIDIYKEMEKIRRKYNQRYNKLDHNDLKIQFKKNENEKEKVNNKNISQPIPIPKTRQK